MSLSGISIKRPVFAWMLMIGLILFGAMALRQMGVGLMPDIDFPQVNIHADYEGASPELMESDIVETLEGALTGIEGVRNISSSAKFGSANITLEFQLSRNIDAAVQDVQSALQGIQRDLPPEMDPPTISKTNPEDRPIMWIGVTGGQTVRELMLYARNQLKDRFASIDGVGDVQLGGDVDPQIRVWLDPNKLNRYEITAEDVLKSIQEEHTEKPVGYIVHGLQEINLRIVGETATAEELANLPVTKRNGTPILEKIQIKDLGRVEAGLDDVRRISRTGGASAVGIGIRKQRGANTLGIAKAVKARMKEIQLPPGFNMSINYDSTQQIQEGVNELILALLLSIFLTAFVCWLFLGSFATTVNVLFAIPTSLLGTFLVISWLGFTLNSFTMLAIILVVGIVVDDTIMILENIVRYREEGLGWKEASQKGAEQITGAAFAATLAIVAIFFPVTLVEGITGAFLYQFGVTLSVAVGISLFEALTFTPMRMSRSKRDATISGIPAAVERGMKKLSAAYGKFIQVTFDRPKTVYGLAVTVFFGSMLFVKILPKEFLPASDTGTMQVRAELPLGTSLEETSRRFAGLEKIILDHPGVSKIFGVIGGGFGGGTNSGFLFVTLKERRERKPLVEVENELRESAKTLGKDFIVRIQGSSAQGFGGKRGYPVELNMRGPEWEKLVKSSRDLMKKMSSDTHFTDVDSSYSEGSPELSIQPLRDAALARGVSVDAVSTALRYLFQGITAARFNDVGSRSEIVVQAEKSLVPKSMENLNKLFVRNNRGNLIRLGEIVKIDERVGASSITRENRERNIAVYANPGKGFSQDQAVNKALELAKEVMDPAMRIEKTGSSAELTKTLVNMTLAILLGIAVAYMVLASQYNSYVHPLVILMALPFSITGAWIALWVGGSSINLYSMIGLLLLMGLVKKNSIMLVELANQLRASGKLTVREAAITAGQTRLRPILMTSFATIAAAIPPAIGLGSSSSATQPMALVVVGGVLFSTTLTLFVVPLAYSHMSRAEKYVDPT